MDIENRLQIQQIFSEGHFFYNQGLLWLESVKEGEPFMSGRIIVGQAWVDKSFQDKETTPKFGLDFPARKITTHMVWDDVVLNPLTMVQVNEISNWLQYHHLFFQYENLK